MNQIPQITSAEQGIQVAHLLIVEGKRREATMLLDSLSVNFPGNVEIQQMIQSLGTEIPLGTASDGDMGSIWNRDYPGQLAFPLLFGVFFCGLGIVVGWPALPSGFEKGIY